MPRSSLIARHEQGSLEDLHNPSEISDVHFVLASSLQKKLCLIKGSQENRVYIFAKSSPNSVVHVRNASEALKDRSRHLDAVPREVV